MSPSDVTRGPLARALLSPDSALSKLALDEEVARAIDSLPNRINELGFDPWGFEPEYAKLAYSLGTRLLWRYFRPEVTGIERLPPGRVLIIANHSGQLPFDALVLAAACLLRADPPRLVRPMIERWFPTLPFLSEFAARCGAVLGDPVNCRNLLQDDQAIVVFPEGAKGIGKTWDKRYQLQHFGRGFMRLALQTSTPIVPVGIVGGEESIVSVANFAPLAKLLGFPYFPISPLLPVLGLGAYLPLPVRFRLHFGEPLSFEGRYDDEDAVIDGHVGVVTGAIDALIAEGRAERKSIFR